MEDSEMAIDIHNAVFSVMQGYEYFLLNVEPEKDQGGKQVVHIKLHDSLCETAKSADLKNEHVADKTNRGNFWVGPFQGIEGAIHAIHNIKNHLENNNCIVNVSCKCPDGKNCVDSAHHNKLATDIPGITFK